MFYYHNLIQGFTETLYLFIADGVAAETLQIVNTGFTKNTYRSSWKPHYEFLMNLKRK